MEDGAESPCAQRGFSKAYRNPGRIHANPGQSDITTRSCPWPCSSGHAVLRLLKKPTAEPVLVFLHLEELP